MTISSIKKIELQDDFPWAAIPENGWKNFAILPPPNSFLKTFDDLVFDQYAAHCQRYRRFSQFKAVFIGDIWKFDLLPHRPFIQSAEYNKFSGGVLRHFEPLECDIAPYLEDVLTTLQTNVSCEYHLDVHQYRVYATPQANGISVPEGPHRDGQQCVIVLIFRRHKITGAQTTLYEPVTMKPLYQTVMGENEGLALNDEKLLHDATPIAAMGNETGHRDYVVININEWTKRRYGDAFEQRAAALVAMK